MKCEPLGGPYLTKTTILASLLMAIMGACVVLRLVFGLAAVSNLNDGYSWGLWLAYDMVAGSAIGCGGYALAVVVYVLNRGQYHPLVRPAVLASMFGYGLGGLSVLVDISRWWNFWHLLVPWYLNPNSVMLEVALCVMTYTTVLVLEFAPAIVERLVWWTRGKEALHALSKRVEKVLNRVVFVFIALGMTLPTMHQSSLGTMLVPFGRLVDPLWQTPILPALYLLTALSMGYAVVIFEATLVSDRFNRPSEANLLGRLAKYLIAVVVAFLAVRWADIILTGKLPQLLMLRPLNLAFLAENVLYAVPLILLLPARRRQNPQFQFIAAACMLAGGVLYRMDGYLVAYHRAGWHYFPSVPELLITFGMIAVEVLGYILIVRTFPVLHSVKPAGRLALQAK